MDIGQWAPVVGTGIAAVGSLYLLLAADMEAEENEEEHPDEQPNTRTVERCTRCDACVISDGDGDGSTSSRTSSQSHGSRTSTEIARTATQPSISVIVRRSTTNQSEHTIDAGGRRKVARLLNMASRQLAAKAYNQFHDSGFNPQGLTDFPEVPGEPFRNKNLRDFQKAYSNTPLPRSRAGSFIESINSDSPNGEGSSRTPQGSSRHLSLPVSPPPHVVTRQRHSNTLPSSEGSFEITGHHDCRNPDGHPSGRQRSSSGGSNSNPEHTSRSPSIPEVSPTDVTFDGQATSPKIVVSTP